MDEFHEGPKNKVVLYMPEHSQAFDNAKQIIATLTMLYFINPAWPLFVATDTSDCGIGTMLYQHDPNG
ncbi:hypothetical protein GGI09_005764 [Coemansia sp. S100]|nr:hypothetical protein GGI09_005764 [Coemansia sp. S100]